MLDGEPPQRWGHTAVHLQHYVLVFGGEWSERPLSLNEIWMYNLYTEQWRKQVLPYGENTPDAIVTACSVVIDSVVYIFGGWNYFSRCSTNALWTLYIKPDGYVAWNELFTANAAKAPSPRLHHCAWEYSGKLWVFGGSGPSPNEYLNNNGDFIYYLGSDVCNNQVLCFDPSNEEWTNPKCTGSTPSPRRGHATAIIKEKVWLFGGWNRFATKAFDELY